jgi:hypothetical protein
MEDNADRDDPWTLVLRRFAAFQAMLWQRLLGRPVSEYGRLCHGNGGPEGGARCRRGLMLAILTSRSLPPPAVHALTPDRREHRCGGIRVGNLRGYAGQRENGSGGAVSVVN